MALTATIPYLARLLLRAVEPEVMAQMLPERVDRVAAALLLNKVIIPLPTGPLETLRLCRHRKAIVEAMEPERMCHLRKVSMAVRAAAAVRLLRVGMALRHPVLAGAAVLARHQQLAALA